MEPEYTAVLREYQAPKVNDDHWAHACEIRYRYGLVFFYSAFEVQLLWERHSESMAAGWLQDNKEDVEQVFGVTLTKIGG